jgi:hypothetical protein
MRRLIRLPLTAAIVTATLSLPAAAQAADRYVAPSGSDSASCTQAAPCASAGRAFQAATAGQTIELAAGAYGGQSIPAVSRSGAPVTIQPAPGAQVSFSGLNVRGSHVVVANIATGFVDIEGGSISDVKVVNGSGGGVFIGGGTNGISIIGGTYGGAENVAPVKIQGSPAPTGVTFDGVVIHDAVRTDDAAHLECMYAADVQQFTVRNSQFRNCAIMDLFFTKLSGVNPKDVVVENNFFDKTGSHSGALSAGYYSLSVSSNLDTAANFLIRNNSFLQSMTIDTPTLSNVRVYNNVGELSACRSGVTYDHNVWTGRKCGSSDKQAASSFVDPANYNLHLKAGAAAIGFGNPANAPGIDIDGGARPAAGPVDAGADEYGATAANAPPPPSGGGGTGPTGGTTPGTGTGTGGGAGPTAPARSSGAKTTADGVPLPAVTTLNASRATTSVAIAGITVARRTISGRVQGARSGQVVVLVVQRRKGNRWVRVRTVRVKVHTGGRFSVRIRVTPHARYRVSAALPGHSQTGPRAKRISFTA